MGGMCCICFGTLTPETAFIDHDYQMWDVHRGKCAILSGIIPPEHTAKIAKLIDEIHSHQQNTPGKRRATTRYYRFVDSIAKEDFYNYEGP